MWPSSSSPLQFLNTVSFMPSCLARSFICFTKTSSLPLMCSASATAASLALATTVALIISSADIVSPGSSQMSLPPMDEACSPAVMVSVSASLPLSIASITSSRVITLVTDAQGRCSWGFFSYRIFPVDASIRTAAGALTSPSSSALTDRTEQANRDKANQTEIIFRNIIKHLTQAYA